MVTVIMRNQQSVDFRDIAAECGKPQLSLPTADPSVKKQTDASGFHVNAIAVTSGRKRDDSHIVVDHMRFRLAIQ